MSTEPDNAAAIERANAYRDMTRLWAWKDLMARVEAEKKSKLDTLMTQKGTENLDFTRGFVSAINFLESELGLVQAKR